jgi:RNA polymerase sigma factor (sigma-70 family)
MDDIRLEQLIRQIHQGDQDALSLVYVDLGKSIYYLAFALTSDSYLSQDVLQETILRIWEHSGLYQPGTRPKAWIYTIARHVTLDMIRRQGQAIRKLRQLMDGQQGRELQHNVAKE